MSFLDFINDAEIASELIALYKRETIYQLKNQQNIDKILAFYQEQGSPISNVQSQPQNAMDMLPQLLTELGTHDSSASIDESISSSDNDDKSCQRKQSVPWLPEEDQLLKSLAEKYQFKNWSFVAYDLYKEFPTRPRRTCNQCNQRWMRVLNPQIIKGKWNLEEDKKLASAILQSPPKKWKQIANLMPGRTDIQVRYRIKKISGWLVKQGVPRDYLVD